MTKGIRGIVPDEGVALGVSAALVLQQARVWIKACRSAKEVEGHRWAFMPLTMLQESLPFLAKNTLLRALISLEECGTLKSRSDLNTKWSNRTKWYAVDEVKVQEVTTQNGYMPTTQNGYMTTTQNGYMTTTQNGYFYKEDKGLDKGLDKGGGISPTEPSQEKIQEKNQSGEQLVAKEDLDKVVAGVLDHYVNKPLVLKPTGLAQYWRLHCALNYEESKFSGVVTSKELGMWKLILVAIPSELKGQEGVFFKAVIEHWNHLKSTVAANTGVSSTPNQPNVAYLLANFHHILGWYEGSVGVPEVVHLDSVNLVAPVGGAKNKVGFTLSEALAQVGEKYDGSSDGNDCA